MGNEWTAQELEILYKHFNTNVTQLPTFQRLQKINPDRTYEAMKHKIRKLRHEGWLKPGEKAESALRIGYLDIEATNLKGNFGFMLSWYIKEQGKNKYDYSVITQKEILKFDWDKRVTRELLEAIAKYDVLYTHYGSDWRFDLPFIRTRAFAHDLEHLIPVKGEVIIRDTYPILRKKLKLHSNRLDVAAKHLKVKTEKTPVAGELWMKAALGDKHALKYVEDHNKKDVIILEGVHRRLECIENKTNTSI